MTKQDVPGETQLSRLAKFWLIVGVVVAVTVSGAIMIAEWNDPIGDRSGWRR